MTKTIHIDARYNKKIKLSGRLINHLKKQGVKSAALFASVQFLDLMIVKQQLRKIGAAANTTKAIRCDKESQILGCDCFNDSFNSDIINKSDIVLYIGDGLFHPKAILLSQIKNKQKKQVILYNPVSKQFKILTQKDIEQQINKIKSNLRKFVLADKIGIVVSVKPGQEHLELALKLKEKLEKEKKKVFIFITDSLTFNELENFPFIKAWVNSACPRIAIDDILHTEKTIVNIKQAFNAINELEEIN
ncbi:MAG: diphthamide synthesis protein [Candidatus Pacearchaeota archaeon]